MKTQLTSFCGALLAAALVAIASPVAAMPFPTGNNDPAQRYPLTAQAAPKTAQDQAPGGQMNASQQPVAAKQASIYPRVAIEPTQSLPTPAEKVEVAPEEEQTNPVAAPAGDPGYTFTPHEGYSELPAGDCGAATPYGADDCGDSGAAAAACYDAGPRPQWFGGVYGLSMQRDRPGTTSIAVVVDDAATPYFPQPSDLFLVSSQADPGFAAGGEVRFGSTFGYACNPGGCDPYQPFAWEIGYWALEEDSSSAVIGDAFGGPTRLYGMIDYTGLEYDRDGAGATYGYRPVNDYFDYQNPTGNNPTNDVRLLANQVRQTFSAKNLELNFWRFGAPTPNCGGGGGASPAGCSNPSGSGCGACETCSCDTPCGVSSGESAAPAQRFFFSGMAGVRFLQFDEYFQNAVFFTTDDGAGNVAPTEPGSFPGRMSTNDDNVLLHDITVDNDLVGFQLGCSMNCLVGCRWSLFCDTNFGIYGNDADVSQRVWSGGGGDVRFVGNGANASTRSSKQDVAFLGECRCGAGYQMSRRWRATAAWRVMGVSGVALAPEQIPQAGFPNAAIAGQIDSNDSLVLHGLQMGVECKY